jgi:hypothetical protein
VLSYAAPFCCSKTFGTYEIQQHNRMKHAEAEQLLQAAAALTAAAAPKTDDNNAQQEALVRHRRGRQLGGMELLFYMRTKGDCRTDACIWFRVYRVGAVCNF